MGDNRKRVTRAMGWERARRQRLREDAPVLMFLANGSSPLAGWLFHLIQDIRRAGARASLPGPLGVLAEPHLAMVFLSTIGKNNSQGLGRIQGQK